MTNSNVKATGYNKNTVGEQTITLTYSSKTTTFKVNVVAKTITSLTIKSLPDKLIYQIGESLDLTGGELTKKYNDGSTKNVSMSNSSVTASGFSSTSIGSKSIQLETEGKRVTFEVSVISAPSPVETRTLESITISNTPKTEYIIGDTLDISNGTIKAVYQVTTGTATYTDYKIIKMTDSNVSVTGFTSSEEGEKTITVKYQDKTTTYTVQVSKKSSNIKSIKVNKRPTKVKYIQYKENLDLTGGSITVEHENNVEEILSLTNEEIEVLDFDNSDLGKITLTVLYKGYETTFEVEIVEEAPDESIKDIKINQKPNKIVYVKDRDGFDIKGLEITVEYTDGTSETIKLEDHPDDYNIVGFDNTKLGEQEVTIIYKGHRINVTVKVVATEGEAQEEAGEYVPIPNTLKAKSVIIILIGLFMISSGIYTIYSFNKKKLNNN